MGLDSKGGTNMTTKELIKAEIDSLPEEDLDELYRLIKDFTRSKPQNNGQSILTKLQQIQFDGPEDLAVNHDLYLIGVKRDEEQAGFRVLMSENAK
jgi:hypothetical protein